MEFSHKKGVWTLIDGLKLHDKHQEHLLCAKHWFKELDDPQGQAAAGYSQAFADTSILVVMMMMRRRWTVMIWNILRMLLTLF